MHLVKEHIHEMAQQGTKLTDEERLHLRNCEDCTGLFRLFVLQQFYTDREVLETLQESVSTSGYQN